MFSQFLKGQKKSKSKKGFTNIASQNLYSSNQDVRSVDIKKNSVYLISQQNSNTKLFDRTINKITIDSNLKRISSLKSRKIFTNPNNFRLKTISSKDKSLVLKENKKFFFKSNDKKPLKENGIILQENTTKNEKKEFSKSPLIDFKEVFQKKLTQFKLDTKIIKNKKSSKSKNSHKKSKTKVSDKNCVITINKKQYSKIFFENVKKNNLVFLKFFFKKIKNQDYKKNWIDFSLFDKEGFSLVHYSVLNNNLKLAKFFYSNKLNFESGSKDQITPLMIAVLKGHKEMIKYLMKIVQNFNATDLNGNTALHYAVVKEDFEIIKILLQNQKIDVNFKNDDDKNILDLAHPRIFMKLNELLRNREKNQDDLFSKKNLKNYKSEDFKNTKTNIFSTKQNSKIEEFSKVDINSFIIHSEIGEGSFGEVYLVEKKDSHNFFALKVLQKQKVLEDNLERYVLTERNVLCGINHPFIVKLRYAFQTDKNLFLVMDYHPGGDLGEYLEKEGVFDEKRAKIYICEIILAIEELHRNNIIFRDLKPENVVLDNQGHALLIDFGLSKQNIRAINKATKSFCGSVAYLAPEMIEKKGHGKSMDWYMLGVLLYEMLVGIPPFYDDCQEVLLYNITSQKLDIPQFISRNLRDLLTKLLEKKPEKRLGSFNGSQDIKNHSWFKDVDWEDVYNKKLTPPIPSSKKLVLFAIKDTPKFLLESNTKISTLNNWTFIENNK